ncbi:gp53-like domain-containing protein [Enterobacter kobei]|uniref:gp53-like domain-containing protein n=1 Tax=Enterobacter kobei TaxID=208224 RepID=UPI003D6F563C
MTIHRFSETSRLTFLLFPEKVGLGELPDFGTAASKNVGTNLDQIPDMSAFASALSNAQSGSGWYRLPTTDGKGLLLQMMLCVSAGAGNANYNFPIPFPNYVYAMAVLPGWSGGSVVNGGTLTKTNSQFYTNGAFSFSVIAIGR